MYLNDYNTAETIRPATLEEWAQSVTAAARDGGAGAFTLDGRTVYVDGEPNDLDERISKLRQSAGVAQDFVMVVICDVALDEVDTSDPDALDEDGLPDYSGGGHSADDLRKIREWLRSTKSAAWTECSRHIADTIMCAND